MRFGLLVGLALFLAPACGDNAGLDADLGDDDVGPAGADQINPSGQPPQFDTDPNDHAHAEVLVDGALLATTLRTAGDRIYWMGKGDAGYELYYVRPTGGPITTVLKFGTEPVDLVFFENDVYWTTERRGRLLRTSLDVPGPVEVLYRDADAMPTAIAVTTKFVYFGATDGCVRRVPLEDSLEVSPVACGAGTPVVIAASEPDVFWGIAEDGILYQAAADGGVADKRAADESFDSRLLIDDSQVYWLNAHARAVKAIGRDGQAAQLLAPAQYAPVGMSMDRYDIYFTTQSDQSIKRVSKSGGEVEVLIGAQADPADIALDSERAYWINEGEATIMAMALQ